MQKQSNILTVIAVNVIESSIPSLEGMTHDEDDLMKIVHLDVGNATPNMINKGIMEVQINNVKVEMAKKLKADEENNIDEVCILIHRKLIFVYTNYNLQNLPCIIKYNITIEL